MVHDGADKPTEQPSANPGLSAERAANLATDNQSFGPAASSFTGKMDGWKMAAAIDGLVVPPLQFNERNGGSDQINDCSRGGCKVNGKDYKDSTEIPGNHPKPLLHPDGKPVIGPDGKEVYGPDRVDLDKIAMDAKNNKGVLSVPQALLNFRHSGQWDFQRVQSDDGKPIFTQKYQNFANIGIGYIMGALGLNHDQMSKYADTYCKFKCSYSEPRNDKYPNLADRQVKDFEIGLKLYQERHPAGR